ncbi:MAG: ATP-dependent dethiobiotin synthetase BioD [Sporichthyaceae bacterium]|nr:ATP-dependent dethiobiotin synthetase BioD [Sporichthyaceae bacterium]
MSVLAVTGTGTGVGKTVVTAAIAALAAARGSRVAVVKLAQTGVAAREPGDLDAVRRLAGVGDVHELARYPDPLSPAAAARRRRLPPLDLSVAADRIRRLDETRDLVLVEGAGGLLVRFDEDGGTLAELARTLAAPLLVVTEPVLGTLNWTALTLEALAHRGLTLAGVVIGCWPKQPDLACLNNVRDLETISARPLSGALPAGAGTLVAADFLLASMSGLGPELGGRFNAADFRRAADQTPRPDN